MLLALWDVLGGTECSKVSSIRPCDSVTMSFHFFKKTDIKRNVAHQYFINCHSLKWLELCVTSTVLGFIDLI